MFLVLDDLFFWCSARYESVSSEGQESVDSHIMASQQQEDTEIITVEDLETPAMLQQTTSEASASKYFYFYQGKNVSCPYYFMNKF